ncbi:type II restriction endonuclease [Helicobacter canis]|uniref:type II restriction endonuclease n=1 Tax=Helicobacter canis TaxID=29419 RepID=UPI00215DA4C7|nr:type II restriction endonuclease [Helicobacter canis]
MHRAAIHKPKADSSVKVDCHALLYAKARNDSKTTDTAELESKIDSLVYTLYNLTNDEIEIIESKT